MQARLNRDTLDNPTYFGEPHTRARGWMDVCRHPRLLDAIEACIGHDIILVYSSFFIKPADGLNDDGVEAQVAWHQDNNYWPAVHGTEGVITVWIAIDDASADDCGGPTLSRSPALASALLLTGCSARARSDDAPARHAPPLRRPRVAPGALGLHRE